MYVLKRVTFSTHLVWSVGVNLVFVPGRAAAPE